jgi:hypothetical protein
MAALPICPECNGSVVAEWTYINSGDWRCALDGTPLHLFTDTPNNKEQ